MSKFEDFFDYYLSDGFDFCISLFFTIIDIILLIVLFITLPLWIIPYKLWKRKRGAE